MSVWVTGAGGQLGRAVTAALEAKGHAVQPFDRPALDVTRTDVVAARLRAERPDAVFHCAAYTDVDGAEADPETAYRVNGAAVMDLCRAATGVGTTVILPSTDYVFSGEGERPYRPDDPIGPINVYGASKAYGEAAALAAGAHLVVRTSWLYGGGGDFVSAILEKARRREPLVVVTDQVGRPTWTKRLARRLVELWEVDAKGILHATGGGPHVSWHGFAEAIVRVARLSTEVGPSTSAALQRPARRPGYSVLDCTTTDAILDEEADDWRTDLREYIGADAAAVRRSGASGGEVT